MCCCSGLFLLWYHWFWGISSYLPDLNLTSDLSAYGLAMYHFGPRDILEKLSPFMSEKIFKMVLNIIKCVILIQTNQFLLLQPIIYSKHVINSSYFHCQSDIGILFSETRWVVWRNARKIKVYWLSSKQCIRFCRHAHIEAVAPLSAFIHVTIKMKKVEKH